MNVAHRVRYTLGLPAGNYYLALYLKALSFTKRP